jgi:outer membrane receptor protein involved in Fe transport
MTTAQAEDINPLLPQSSEPPVAPATEFSPSENTDAATAEAGEAMDDAVAEFSLPDSDEASDSMDDATAEFALPDDAEATAGTDDSSVGEDGEIYHILPDFVVSTEGDQGYYSANTTGATRANTLVKNTPITLSVVNEELLADLNILTDEDLELVAPSIEGEQNSFSLNQITIRGFRSGSSRYDLFVRGLTRDGYNTGRLDIIRGANSLIYGQADPGGKVNYVPKMAQFNDSFVSVSTAAGTNDYRRGMIDVNQVVNDDLAVRIMAVDHEQGYDQTHRSRTFRGATLEATYMPTDKTQLRMHLETVESDLFYPSKNMLDRTGLDNTGLLNGMQYTPDAIALLPQTVIDAINNDPTNITNGVSTQSMAELYSRVSKEDYGSFEGPDAVNGTEGFFGILDWTQRVSDTLQFKVAYSHQEDYNDSFNRAGIGAVRLDDPNQQMGGGTPPLAQDEPYLRTNFKKRDGDTITDGIRATSIWEVDFKDTKHTFLFGYDFDRSEIRTLDFEEIFVGGANANGTYSVGTRAGRTDRGYDLLRLSDGPFGPNIGFDTLASNPYAIEGIRNGSSEGAYDTGATMFTLESDKQSKLISHGLWGAIQSEYFNGRLRSLAGIRYDTIDIDSSELVVQRFGDEDDGDDFPTNTKEDQFSPSIGVLYWLTDEVGIFANYAHSIRSPQATQRTVFGELPGAETGIGYEGGFRFDLFDSKLNGQIVAFYIEKENDIGDKLERADVIAAFPLVSATGGMTYPELYVDPTETTNRTGNLLGSVGQRVNGLTTRSEGLEVEFYYNPNRNMTFTFQYAYTNYDRYKIPSSLSALEGRQIYGQASHNASLIAKYSFNKRGPLKGFSIGANQRYRSASVGQDFVDGSGAKIGELEYEDEHTTGAFISWKGDLGSGRNAPQLGLQLAVSNLFDNTDLINRGDRGFYKEGRNLRLSANIKF